jgi:hypothetical protein
MSHSHRIENKSLVLKISQGADMVGDFQHDETREYKFSVLCPFDFIEGESSAGAWEHPNNLPIGTLDKVRIGIGSPPEGVSDEEYAEKISKIKLIIVTKKLVYQADTGTIIDINLPNVLGIPPYPLTKTPKTVGGTEPGFILQEINYEVVGFLRNGSYIESSLDRSLGYVFSVNTHITFKIENPGGVSIKGTHQEETPIVVSLGETDNVDFPKICFYVDTSGYIVPHHIDKNRSYSISYLYASYKNRPHSSTHCGESIGEPPQNCGGEGEPSCGDCPWAFKDCYIDYSFGGRYRGPSVRNYYGERLNSSAQSVTNSPNVIRNQSDRLAFEHTYDYIRYYQEYYSYIIELIIQDYYEAQPDQLLLLDDQLTMKISGEVVSDTSGLLRFPGYAKLLELSSTDLHMTYEEAVNDNTYEVSLEMSAGAAHPTFAIAFISTDDSEDNLEFFNWKFTSDGGLVSSSETNGFSIQSTTGEITAEGVTAGLTTDNLIVGVKCGFQMSTEFNETGGEYISVEGTLVGPDEVANFPEAFRHNTGHAIISNDAVWVGTDEFPDLNIPPHHTLFFIRDTDDAYFDAHIGDEIVVKGRPHLSTWQDGDTGVRLDVERIQQSRYVKIGLSPVNTDTLPTTPIIGEVEIVDNELVSDTEHIIAPSVAELRFSSSAGVYTFKYGEKTSQVGGFSRGFVYPNLAGRSGCSECGDDFSSSYGCTSGHFHSLDGRVSPISHYVDARGTYDIFPRGIQPFSSNTHVCGDGSRVVLTSWNAEKYEYLNKLGIEFSDAIGDREYTAITTEYNREVACEDQGLTNICRELDGLDGLCPASYTGTDYTDVYPNITSPDPLYGFPTANGCWRNCCKDYVTSGWLPEEIPGCGAFWDHHYLKLNSPWSNEPENAIESTHGRYAGCGHNTHIRVDYGIMKQGGVNSHDFFANSTDMSEDDGYDRDILVFPMEGTSYSALYTTNPLVCEITSGPGGSDLRDASGQPIDDFIGTTKSWCDECPDDTADEVCGDDGITYINACVAACISPDVKIIDWDNPCSRPTPTPTPEPAPEPCDSLPGVTPQLGVHTHVRLFTPELYGNTLTFVPNQTFEIEDWTGPDYWNVNLNGEMGGPRIRVTYIFDGDESPLLLSLDKGDQDIKWELLNGVCEEQPPPEPPCDWESWYTCSAQTICVSGDFTILNGQYNATSLGTSDRPTFRHDNGSEFRLTSDCKWSLYDSEGELVYWSTNTDSLFPPDHVGETCPTDSSGGWNPNWSDGTSVGDWSHDQRLKRELGPCDPSTPTPSPEITIVSVDVNEQVENNVTLKVSHTNVHRWYYKLDTWQLDQTGIVNEFDGDNITFTAPPGQHVITVYAMDEEMQDIPGVTDDKVFIVPAWDSEYDDLSTEVTSVLYECPEDTSTWGCGAVVPFDAGQLEATVPLNGLCESDGDRCMFGPETWTSDGGLGGYHFFVERVDDPEYVYVPEKIDVASNDPGDNHYLWFKGFLVKRPDAMGYEMDVVELTPTGISVLNNVSKTYETYDGSVVTGNCWQYSAREIQSVFYNKQANEWLDIQLKWTGLPNPGIDMDCVLSEWEAWGDCNGCGDTGQQTRIRSVIIPQKGTGTPCENLLDAQSCTGIPCPIPCVVSDWELSGDCSAECAGGLQTYTRTVTISPQHGAPSCPPLSKTEICNTQICPVPCVLSDWIVNNNTDADGWSVCSAECDGGAQKRTRTIIQPPLFGAPPCDPLEESRPCNIHCCPVTCVVSDWIVNDDTDDEGWSDCSVVFCGGGTKTRTRTEVAPAECGGTCVELSETVPCNEQTCPVDCEVSSWTGPGPCLELSSGQPVSCGGGVRRYDRTIITDFKGTGEPCPALVQYDTCNEQSCKTDCVGAWTPWSDCAADECEDLSGSQRRTFIVTTPALSGGTQCDHNDGDVETQECYDFSCVSGCVQTKSTKCTRYASPGGGPPRLDGALGLFIPGSGGEHEIRGKGRDPFQLAGPDDPKQYAEYGENAKHGGMWRDAYSPCINPQPDDQCALTNNFFIIEFPETFYVTGFNGECGANWFSRGKKWWENGMHGTYDVHSENRYERTTYGAQSVLPDDMKSEPGQLPWTYQSTYQDDLAISGNFTSNIILVEPSAMSSPVCGLSCNITDSILHNAETPLFDMDNLRQRYADGSVSDFWTDIPYGPMDQLLENRWNLVSRRQTLVTTWIDMFKNLPPAGSDDVNPYSLENFKLYRNENFLPETPGWFDQSFSTTGMECCQQDGKFGYPAKAIMFQLIAGGRPTYTNCFWDNTISEYNCKIQDRTYGSTSHAVRAIEGLPFLEGFWASDDASVDQPHDLLSGREDECKITSRLITVPSAKPMVTIPAHNLSQQILANLNKFPPTRPT